MMDVLLPDLSLPSDAGYSTGNHRRQRINRACESCRLRKVRCDMIERQPCSNCALRQRRCYQVSSRQRNLPLPTAADRPTLTSPLVPGKGTAQVGPFPSPQSHRGHRRLSQSHDSLGTSSSPGSQTAAPSTVTVDDTVWARNLHQMTQNPDAQPDIQDQNTSPESSSSTWSTSLPARKRVKFGGESLAHSLLPLMDGHAELSSGHENGTAGKVNRESLRTLTAPLSKQHRGTAPWINADCQAHLDTLSHLPLEDRYYLYNTKKVFRFPQRSVTTELVRVFFQVVCPLQPVMDRRITTDLYLRLYTHQQSSPLLFHAMFFCACSFADEAIIHEAGFQDATEAKLYFGSRARILYSYDCEPDHLFVVQALILLSFWWMDYTEEKDMKYWLSCAVNLALTMGMHKALPKRLSMSPTYHSLWRRIFWTLFAREHTVAAALGQPLTLLLASCDLAPLSETDFEEGFDSSENVLSLSKQTTCHIYVALKIVTISIQLEKLMLNVADAQDDHDVVLKLSDLRSVLDSPLSSMPQEAIAGVSVDDSSTWNISNVCLIFLCLLHERVQALYYRRRERALLNILRNSRSRSSNTPLMSSDTRSLHPNHANEDLKEARDEIFHSAKRVIILLEKLRAVDLLRFAPSHVNTVTFHSILTLAERIVGRENDTQQWELVKNSFNSGLEALNVLRRYWAVASWSYAMFSDLALNDFQPLKALREKATEQSRLPSRTGSPSLNQSALSQWDEELLDPMQYLVDWVPLSMDPFGDWSAVDLDSQSPVLS